nr:gastrula zinc finger protein xFG20 1 [Hymenolepis microstoma]
MDLSQQHQKFHCLPQIMDLANNYAAILSKLALPLPIPPPNMIRDFLYNKQHEIENPLPENQLTDVPMNLCIRDQKSQSLFLNQIPEKVTEFLPSPWSLPRLLPGRDALPLPLKVKESLFPMSPTRRRTGCKGLSVCAACFKAFNKMSDLNQHYMQRHKDLLEKEWTAALNKRQRRCCKSTSRRRLLCDQLEEESVYSKPFHSRTESCDHLSGGKSENRARKGHICPWCNYCAKWPTELQKHIVVHANLRPFACMICNNCYKWSWDLGRHFSTVHAGLPNPYKMSKKNLRAQLQLKSNVDTTTA